MINILFCSRILINGSSAKFTEHIAFLVARLLKNKWQLVSQQLYAFNFGLH